MFTPRKHSLVLAAVLFGVLLALAACSSTPPAVSGSSANSLLGAAGPSEPTAVPTAQAAEATEPPAEATQEVQTVTELIVDTGAVQQPAQESASLPQGPAYDVAELDV